MTRAWYLLVWLVLFSFNMEAQDTTELVVQSGHFRPVKVVNFSPDGKYLVSVADDDQFILWEMATGKIVKIFNSYSSIDGFTNVVNISSACFSPDSRNVLSGCYSMQYLREHTTVLWDLAWGRKQRAYPFFKDKVFAVCVSPDMKYALAGGGKKGNGQDTCMKLYNYNNTRFVRAFFGHSDTVTSVCITPDSKYILSGSADQTIKQWDINTGKVIKTFTGHTGKISSTSLFSDGKFILSASGNNEIILWEVESGKIIKKFQESEGISSVAISPDGKYFIAGTADKNLENVKLWDIESGKIVGIFKGHTKKVNSVCFSPDGKYAASGSDDTRVKFWDISTGKEIELFAKSTTEILKNVCFSNEGRFSVAVGSGNLKVWDFSVGKMINTIPDVATGENLTALCISNNGNYVLYGNDLFEVSTKKKIITLPIPFSDIVFGSFSNRTGLLAVVSSAGKVFIYEIATGKQKFTVSPDGLANIVCFSPDDNLLITGDNQNKITLFKVSSGEKLRTLIAASGKQITAMAVSPDNSQLISGHDNAEMNIWDINSGNKLKKISFKKVSGKIQSLFFSKDGKQILYSTKQLAASFNLETADWKPEKFDTKFEYPISYSCIPFSANFANTKKVIAGGRNNIYELFPLREDKYPFYHYPSSVIFTSNGDEWVAATPDMYFDCSNAGTNCVAMTFANQGFNIDQMALRYNRPDIILQHIGCEDKDLILHYYNMYKKRLRKAGFTEDQLSSELHAPTATIKDMKQNKKSVTLSFTLSDDMYKLKRYNVYVNDVPLFGSYGKNIPAGKSEVSLTENIELTSGTNKIEISCQNEKGEESFRALRYADYKEKVKGNLYYLGFGVSKYANPQLNLEYADKDAKDLATVFEKMKGEQFADVFIKTFINEDVTPANIKKAKDFVKNAKVDDTFVLFIAGHGMHDTDADATYYYLTTNANPKMLKTTAADFETIEDLLQGIPPRNKLFLMDACESGEIDDEVQTTFITQADQKGVKSRGMKAVKAGASTTSTGSVTSVAAVVGKRSYLYQKDRYIYNDLVRRSGAIVFSSSKGGELSYERSDIENGLFTEYIMKALSSDVADKDKNGIVSTDELREYVSSEVAKASGDLQHPTVDRDNIYQKFGFDVK